MNFQHFDHSSTRLTEDTSVYFVCYRPNGAMQFSAFAISQVFIAYLARDASDSSKSPREYYTSTIFVPWLSNLINYLFARLCNNRPSHPTLCILRTTLWNQVHIHTQVQIYTQVSPKLTSSMVPQTQIPSTNQPNTRGRRKYDVSRSAETRSKISSCSAMTRAQRDSLWDRRGSRHFHITSPHRSLDLSFLVSRRRKTLAGIISRLVP